MSAAAARRQPSATWERQELPGERIRTVGFMLRGSRTQFREVAAAVTAGGFFERGEPIDGNFVGLLRWRAALFGEAIGVFDTECKNQSGAFGLGADDRKLRDERCFVLDFDIEAVIANDVGG